MCLQRTQLSGPCATQHLFTPSHIITTVTVAVRTVLHVLTAHTVIRALRNTTSLYTKSYHYNCYFMCLQRTQLSGCAAVRTVLHVLTTHTVIRALRNTTSLYTKSYHYNCSSTDRPSCAYSAHSYQGPAQHNISVHQVISLQL